ncbi:MAG: four helix bundle protein [Prolixibacteraceae bacterium]|jgi:four helix bundle protein|nr:four helix bundle protein [Prolixibacteraceae bacterium]MBT6006493.1 four helix bundle protein [Prolixibacteraceae bacterium]MBT6764158.1 four helix bundle protein [Prolixibacteraceae bacterium]MBT6998615.1 four helix bundle protein [Prolixibacteraceae bacterium]MBT7397416.1 four helix bundle protein [Prolixibacteraceae bacterium]
MNKYDLEERLIWFSVRIIELSDFLHKTIAGSHLNKQLVRSATSPAFNYGEAQSAESPRDFIHKMGVCLKELCETFINIKIIKYAKLSGNEKLLDMCYAENNELISIFVKSIETAKRNNSKI